MERNVVYMHMITHESKIQEDKINYFVDCLHLYTASMGFPFCPERINARILCNSLLEITQASSTSKIKYLIHYYSNHQWCLSENYILNKKFNTQLVKLNGTLNELFALFNCSEKTNEGLENKFNDVFSELSTICLLLNADYFDNIIDTLKTAVFCKEDLFSHDHKAVIEEASKNIITELYYIGFPKDKIRDVFRDAIQNRYEDFNELYRSQILNIPVPKEVYETQNQVSFTVYKNKVRKYLSEGTLINQFDNLKHIYHQAQRTRSFVFRINNLQMEDIGGINFNGMFFKSDIADRHVQKSSRAKFKKFFVPGRNYSFCEVNVPSGNEKYALIKAISLVNEGINFLYYHASHGLEAKMNRPYIDFKQYVSNDLVTTITERFHNGISIRSYHSKQVQELDKLESNRGNKVINDYLEVDKIFLSAFSLESEFEANSELWRYCESLFEDNKNVTPEKIITKLVNFYIQNSKGLKLAGVQRMVQYYVNNILHSSDSKISELGLTHNELRLKEGSYSDIKEYVKEFNKIIKHPIINSKKEEVFNLNNSEHILREFYTNLMRSVLYQRNLFQHSNVKIEGIKNIWFEESIVFVETVRYIIIEKLKSNPSINMIEELFEL